VNRVERRRRAAVLLILAWTLALHAWVPALLAIAFVSWVILHKRLESDFGDALARRWRRGWPPGRLVLILLLAASTSLVWESDARPLAKVLPVTLDILGLSMILLGGWLTPVRWTTAKWRPHAWTRAGMAKSPSFSAGGTDQATV
jgi:hypothetical protein